MSDPYAILGISKSATDEELTRAYKSLARKYHPDLNPGDLNAEQKMKDINCAYDTIQAIRAGKPENPTEEPPAPAPTAQNDDTPPFEENASTTDAEETVPETPKEKNLYRLSILVAIALIWLGAILVSWLLRGCSALLHGVH